MIYKHFLLLLLLSFYTLLAQEQPLERVSVQLKWKHQFQFAGFYMAKEKGFYKEAGLDVALFEYEAAQDIVESVLSQEREYGVAYPSLVYEKTEKKDIVLLSALLQSSPYVLASLKSSGIDSIEDFKGKKITIAQAATHTTSLLSMLRSHGLSFGDMQRFDPEDDVQKLLNKEVDLIAGFKSNQIYQLQKAEAEINIWDPKEYGFDFYDDLLFTSQKELDEHPQRVEKFLYATLRGYEYAYANQEEAIALILKKYNTQNKSLSDLRYEAQTLKSLAFGDGSGFGEINPVKIQRIMDIYNLFGHIKEKVDLENFIYKKEQGIHLTYEEKMYLSNKKSIKMCVDPNWMPFEEYRDGVYSGMSADYFKILQKSLPIPFEVVPVKSWQESVELAKKRECDIFSLAMETPERKKYMNFTDAYLSIPLVMATKTDAPFMSDFSSLSGKKVGIASGYAFLELLRLQYPKLDIVEVENLDDGLKKVVQGEIYGYIGTLATIGYSFQKNYTGELKIAGKFDGSWDLGIGVRNDDEILFDLLQKAVRSVDIQERQKILNDWLAIKYERSVDYSLLLKIVAAFVLILSLILFFYLRERRLKKSILVKERLLQDIINNIPNPLFFKDREGIFQYVNNAFSKNILGLTNEELIGKKLEDLKEVVPLELIVFHQNQDAILYEDHNSLEYESSIKMSDGVTKEFQITKKVFNSEFGECLGYIGVMSDITDLKQKEKKLQELASIDSLTHLYNRRHFSKVAQQALELAKRHSETLCVIMLDIDNFKKINDTYGHKIGDDVIIRLANILQETSRKSDIVARFGGEEFVLLLPKTHREGASIIAEKIREKSEELLITLDDGSEISFTISLGVSEINIKEESDVEEGIKRADAALYASKRSGKNRVSIA